MSVRPYLLALICALATLSGPARAGGDPVRIGLDAEISHKTSTSDDAIRIGILAAIEEINRRGGVLGGRPLALDVRDNRSVPARGADNLRELASLRDLVAVFTSKFSPVVIEQLPLAHRLQIPLLDPWAAADDITEHGYTPNYVFRLSLRDSWAMDHLLRAAERRRWHRVGLIIPNGAWGRSSLAAAQGFMADHTKMQLTEVAWFNWSDTSFASTLQRMRAAGAQVLLLVGNEGEAAQLARDLASLAPAQQLPVLSHWGVSGGDYVKLAGPAAAQIDLQTVQTFSFLDPPTARGRQLLGLLRDKFALAAPEKIPSPSGLAHAYELTHILARAVDLAGSTDRPRIRDALERVRNVSGLLRNYAHPFAPDRREALDRTALFLARYRADGALVRSR